MTQNFSHNPWTVSRLVDGLDTGSIRLPDIQRPFVWRNAKVRDLIDSMFRGYPVGELMFWRSAESGNTRVFGVDDDKQENVSYQVVDGQQRLTSLYAVMMGVEVWREDYSRETIQIAFNPLTERFAVPDNATGRSPQWINDIRGVFADPIEARYAYLAALRESDEAQVDTEVERRVEVAIQRLASLRDYGFAVVQINEEVSREVVADIFVRANSEGVSLKPADFILTWMSVFWEDGRNELETWARDSRFSPEALNSILGTHVRWTPRNPYINFDPGQLLRVAIAVGLRRGRLGDAYNRLRGRNPRTREIEPEVREKELARLQLGQSLVLNPLNWDEFLRVLERAGFRSEKMISSKSNILYTYALWLIGRRSFNVPVDQLREIMARWFFMSQITGRYTSSPETRIQEDLNRLDGLSETPAAFLTALDGQISTSVTRDWWELTLPNLLETSNVDGPAYLSYVAALNVLDADVLLSTSKLKDWTTPRPSIKGIEKHHLFPREYLQHGLGITSTRQINQAANMAMVEWSDNIDISDRPPHEYWPQQVADKAIEEQRRRRQEQWHALPPGWTEMEYNTFLVERRRLIARATHEGFKRLTDPNYEPDLSRPADLAQPAAALPSFERLVVMGALSADMLMSPVNDETDVVAEVTEDGSIRIGEHFYESLERATREVDPDVEDPWAFWTVATDNGDVPLAALRESAARQ
ncbi:GmrSD restriction endonuclease domain-containing protein [Demequina lutea]|uniref:GmrSD restriction endonucleases N-terminal domain-containing protein n=1 Tax=Demequina lutea TaxID=431489 RepID=A0A7Y9ZBP0_9MICO|nr:DUF262 domain-containing protein [Demequina lutea]NYI42417.1 hypothetical protein [Demequina lutea]